MNTTRAISALLLLLLTFGCGSDEDKPAKPVVAKPAAAAPRKDPGLTEPMAAEFGAATMVPENCGYFATSLRLKQQWEAVRDSNAIAMLLELPTVQMAIGQLMRSPQWLELQQMRKQVPQVQTGLDVLEDAFSQETFICLDERWPTFVSALSAIYLQMTLASMGNDPFAPPNAAVAATLEFAEDVRLPGVLLGFRLNDPARAQKLLAELVAQYASAVPLPIATEEIGGATFHTLRLAAPMIPPPARKELNETLTMMEVPADRIKKLNLWIDKQTVAIAIGVRDDYLLISVDADAAQLATLGTQASLAQSEHFAPLRSYFQPGVVSLSYIHKDLTNSGKIPVADALAGIEGALAWTGADLPPELPARLRKDAAGFLEDLNKGLPEAHAELSIAFFNKGVESYSFGARMPTMDASRPLSILSSAGPAPLLAVAWHSLPSKEAYERLSHWIGVGYGYFEDFAVPNMSTSDLKQFRGFEETFLAVAQDMHETTLNQLIPAVDACQGLFVLGSGGQLPMIPGVPVALPSPLRYPQPAFVFEINDAKQLTAAFASYRTSINKFMARMAENDRELLDTQLPAPQTREFGGGMLYSYPVPLPPQLKLLPHAVVTKDRAVVAIAEAHSTALLKATPLPAGGVVDLSAPAGSACWIDIAGITAMLFDDAEIGLHVMASSGEIDPQQAELVKSHLPVARKVLGVLRSYTSRTWIEGDTAVTHAWLHIEDAKR